MTQSLPVLPAELAVHHFTGRDGVPLAWHEMGDGRPLVLLHGLLGSGALLAGSGPAQALAARGYRVILPDLRGHGDSGRSHDPACYPPDVLAVWIAGSGADPWAVRAVLGTSVATPAQALREVPVPTLIVVGDGDSRGASAGELAALLPNGRLARVPGDHLTALEAPEFTGAVLEFLAA